MPPRLRLIGESDVGLLLLVVYCVVELRGLLRVQTCRILLLSSNRLRWIASRFDHQATWLLVLVLGFGLPPSIFPLPFPISSSHLISSAEQTRMTKEGKKERRKEGKNERHTKQHR